MHFPLEAKLPFELSSPDREFKFVQLDNNPAIKFKIWANLPHTVETHLVECLRANADLFVSPKEMSGIDASVTCHKLNVNSGIKPISHKRHHQSPENA